MAFRLPLKFCPDYPLLLSQARFIATALYCNHVGAHGVHPFPKLKRQPGKDILIEGSAIFVESLVQAGLIDEYKLLVHPVIVGSGKRFFKEGMGMTRLKLVESKTLSLGVVLLSYEPAK